jgi:pSer/pThr/pTyr-binding forkhead associated (FHA) protein
MLDELGAEHALLVKLERQNTELEIGLALTFAGSTLRHHLAQNNGAPIRFETQSSSVADLLARRTDPRPRDSRRPAADDTPAYDFSRNAFKLVYEPCFVMPIRKQRRGARVLGEQITIGRARNHDIVLRHASVSKFHAFFDITESGELWLRDAGSKNHTLVEGTRIAEGGVRPRPGDVVRFGTVDTVYVDADTLFRLLSRR